VILDGLKETGDILRQEAYSFDVMFGQHLANAMKVGPIKSKNMADNGASLGTSKPFRWIEIMKDLSIIVAILFEHTMQELQFSCS